VTAGTNLILNVGFAREGIPLDEDTRVGLRFKDHGVLAAVVLDNLPVGFEPPVPTVASRAALRRGFEDAGRPAEGLRTSAEPRLQYLPDEGMFGRLVWRFELRGDDPVDPFVMDYWVHARGEGEILRSRTGVHYVDVQGKVEGRPIVFDPVTSPEVRPFPEIRVSIVSGGSGEAHTDENGDFTIPFGGSGTITVQSPLVGRWATVDNTAGSEEVLSATGTPPGPFEFLHNPSGNDEYLTAQANGYWHTTRIHRFVENILGPSNADNRMTVNVNINSSCNAYYNGSINFFRAGGGCRNTAFDTVIYHEYGHYLDAAWGGVHQPFSEGIADAFAMYITDQPIVGENFTTGGGFVRTGESDRQWPASECGGEVHCVGEVLTGAMWKLRLNLQASLGGEIGGALADQLLVYVNATNPFTIPDAALELFVVDDDDGILGNGTPHFFEIQAAMEAHNLPAPDPPFVVDIDHVALDNTVDQFRPYPVTATITSVAGEITSANLLYSVDGGAFALVPMEPTGEPDEFGAEIPAMPCGSKVRYYVEAADAAGFSGSDPLGSPDRNAPHYFVVARKLVLYSEDFEDIARVEGEWYLTPGSDFEIGPPNEKGDNPWDPLAAFSGENVIGTDLNSGDDDGYYRPDYVSQARSPNIDCSGKTGVHLSFRRWLTIEDASKDRAQLLVQSSDAFDYFWTNPSQSSYEGLMDLVDASWIPRTYDVSAIADGDPLVKVYFRLRSNEQGAYGGWNVDDVELFTLSCDLVTLQVDDVTPSLGQPVTFATAGGPGAEYWLLSAKGLGDGTFPVPGGPVVETGLDPATQGVRRQAFLDGAGQDAWTKSIPSNPGLVGKTFHLVSVSENAGWQASNRVEMTIEN
jgi:hypothetical protein